jgi:nucleotide-binding universal stress UspA family protein
MVGSAGRTGTARFLKGSVAEDIVTRAHCPVTVVR